MNDRGAVLRRLQSISGRTSQTVEFEHGLPSNPETNLKADKRRKKRYATRDYREGLSPGGDDENSGHAGRQGKYQRQHLKNEIPAHDDAHGVNSIGIGHQQLHILVQRREASAPLPRRRQFRVNRRSLTTEWARSAQTTFVDRSQFGMLGKPADYARGGGLRQYLVHSLAREPASGQLLETSVVRAGSGRASPTKISLSS